jgi:hypothetical protein
MRPARRSHSQCDHLILATTYSGKFIFFKNALYRGSSCNPLNSVLNLIAYGSESFSAYARSSHLKASSDSPRNAYTVATPDGLVLLEMATKIGRNSHAAFKGAASTRNAIMGLRLDAAR